MLTFQWRFCQNVGSLSTRQLSSQETVDDVMIRGDCLSCRAEDNRHWSLSCPHSGELWKIPTSPDQSYLHIISGIPCLLSRPTRPTSRSPSKGAWAPEDQATLTHTSAGRLLDGNSFRRSTTGELDYWIYVFVVIRFLNKVTYNYVNNETKHDVIVAIIRCWKESVLVEPLSHVLCFFSTEVTFLNRFRSISEYKLVVVVARTR